VISKLIICHFKQVATALLVAGRFCSVLLDALAVFVCTHRLVLKGRSER